ncbi:multivesicular body subunit 12B-like [Paramacrobiotus metropolitanus]|uniref:multivesicular body subunit 12B-like n=1 Tax=Paramacrobiotus metropolitanus TaxID=2943436 RepID=UPI002445E01F|nr:multivesicular body subunit 12B-like [Paramacrobiotus metropolitanus]
MAAYEGSELDPVTGLCIVTSKNACPLGYKCIDSTYDQQMDADLWKESFLSKSQRRYFCITRFFPLDNGRLNNVVESMCLINEKNNVLPGYTLVDTTYDTNERAIRKKYLTVKMVPRYSVQEAICEIIVLNKMPRAPNGYDSIGKIDELIICTRKGRVPPENFKALSPSNSGANAYMLQQSDVTGAKTPEKEKGKPSGTLKLKSPSVDTQTGLSLARRGSRTLRLNSVTASLGVDDVPFKLGLIATNLSARKTAPVPTIPLMTLEDIENKFKYDFSLERRFLADCELSGQ